MARDKIFLLKNIYLNAFLDVAPSKRPLVVGMCDGVVAAPVREIFNVDGWRYRAAHFVELCGL